MKNLFRITSLAAILLAGLTQVTFAQEQTDELLSLTFNLTAVVQGGTTTNRNTITTSVQTLKINTSSIIQALGASTGNAFSANAGLFLLTPTNDLDAWIVQVRDGNLAVDVSPYFVHQPGNDVGSVSFNTKTGAANAVDYSVDGFVLQDEQGFPGLSLHLNLSGLTSISLHTSVSKKGVTQVDKINAQVFGSGDSQGNPLVASGTISATGLGTETVIIGPVGN